MTSDLSNNILLGLNGFLYVPDIREIVPIIQRITNGSLTSASATGVTFANSSNLAGKSVEEMQEIPQTTQTPSSSSSASAFTVSSLPAPITRMQEFIQSIGVLMIIVGLAIVSIALSGIFLQHVKTGYREDVAAICLIPAVFGTWLFLIVSITIVNYIAIGPIVDIFHIDLKNFDKDDEAWLDSEDILEDAEADGVVEPGATEDVVHSNNFTI